MKLLSVRIFSLALAGLGFLALPVVAQSVQHLSSPQPGGMPGMPVMGGIRQLTNGVQLTWDGPSGYYQVFQKSNSLTAPWVALGKATNSVRTAIITQLYSNAFFRVAGPAPKYVGYQACIACHLNVCRYETNTPHATAFSNPAFQQYGGQNNPACLACHTVGYGLPTGFVSAALTPRLAGVQCENCHGPAGNHTASEDDPSVRPRVEIAATMCGGCHTGYPSPTYEQWQVGGHATVTPDALAVMAASTNNITTCGACHSGSARLALIKGKNPSQTLVHDYAVPLTCVVCHDPHQTNANPAQLRSPLASTNDFHLTSANLATPAAFTNAYAASANVNLCAQCHNDRGAAWTDTARAPHHSLQYNLLLGSVGVLSGYGPFNPGSHGGMPSSADYSTNGTFYLTNQCASCHMTAAAAEGGHDHSLAVNYDVCAKCHLQDARLLVKYSLQPSISNKVTSVISVLNRWAALKAPASLVTNANVVAWEYTTAGGLTWHTNPAGFATSWSLTAPVLRNGPDAAGQALLKSRSPGILQARYNLYLVLNDGSMGVHNPFYALALLDAAVNLVGQEINK